MTDIFGPASSLNAVTSRPSEDRNFSSPDSWFKNCSTPSSQDGTEVSAGWLNGMTGSMRVLTRINGLKLDGINPVVAYDESDNMLCNAVQQLVQRGLLNGGVDSGGVNAVVVTLLQTPSELVIGFPVTFKALIAPTGPATLLVTGLNAAPILRRGGASLAGGDWSVGDLITVRWTGAAWQLAGLVASDVKVRLQANTICYVDAALGSDANNGQAPGAGHAWQSIQHAIDTIAANFDLNGNTVTIQLANGSYTAATATRPWVGGGPYNVVIVGNNTSPSSVIITNTTTSNNGALGSTGTGVGFRFSGVTLLNTQAIVGGCLYCDELSLIQIVGPVIFAGAYQSHMTAPNGGTIIIATSSYTIAGSAADHLYATNGGKIIFANSPCAVAIQNVPNFSVAFAVASDTSVITMSNQLTFSGSAVGSRYAVNSNAVIESIGQGASFLPGNAAGTYANGGQYL